MRYPETPTCGSTTKPRASNLDRTSRSKSLSKSCPVGNSNFKSSALDVTQIVTEHPNSPFSCGSDEDIIRAHRGEQNYPLTCTREKNVQTAVTLTTRDRTKPLRHPFLTDLATIGQRDHDKITFVTLNVFQILNEKRLRPALAGSFVACIQITLDRLIPSGPIELLANSVSLLNVNRDNAESRNFLVRQVSHAGS